MVLAGQKNTRSDNFDGLPIVTNPRGAFEEQTSIVGAVGIVLKPSNNAPTIRQLNLYHPTVKLKNVIPYR